MPKCSLSFAHVFVGVAIADDVVVGAVTHDPAEGVSVTHAVLDHVIGPAVSLAEALGGLQDDAPDVHEA